MTEIPGKIPPALPPRAPPGRDAAREPGTPAPNGREPKARGKLAVFLILLVTLGGWGVFFLVNYHAVDDHAVYQLVAPTPGRPVTINIASDAADVLLRFRDDINHPDHPAVELDFYRHHAALRSADFGYEHAFSAAGSVINFTACARGTPGPLGYDSTILLVWLRADRVYDLNLSADSGRLQVWARHPGLQVGQVTIHATRGFAFLNLGQNASVTGPVRISTGTGKAEFKAQEAHVAADVVLEATDGHVRYVAARSVLAGTTRVNATRSNLYFECRDVTVSPAGTTPVQVHVRCTGNQAECVVSQEVPVGGALAVRGTFENCTTEWDVSVNATAAPARVETNDPGLAFEIPAGEGGCFSTGRGDLETTPGSETHPALHLHLARTAGTLAVTARCL